jgi:hypothetical protein
MPALPDEETQTAVGRSSLSLRPGAIQANNGATHGRSRA